MRTGSEPSAARRSAGGLLIALLASAALATAVASAAAGSAAVTQCATANLRIDKVGAQGFTSHEELILALRNVAPTTCRLSGYPRVQLLDVAAGQLPTTVTHHPGAIKTVMLAPWHRAFFTFTYTTNGPCAKAVFAYGAQVIPPGAHSRLVWYSGRFGLCGPSPATVDVSPVTATRPF